jgi:hypothetical protein
MTAAGQHSQPRAADSAAVSSRALLSVRVRRLRQRAPGFLVLLIGALCLPTPAGALEIQQTHWGFDGQVVANRFNLLSLLVANSSSEPFDGRLQLQKSVARLPVDAPLVETVYLAPYSSRWVQFHPYAKFDWEEWTVSWGPAAAGSFSLTHPRQGKPACVLIEEAGALEAGGAGLRRFPENLFPAHLTAMDGLASVVLDHAPHWEEGRQRAFLDWVKNGGQVHLLRDQQGRYPRFTGELQELNAALPRSRLGCGVIQHHERDRRAVDLFYVEQILVPGRDPAEAVTAASAAPAIAPAVNDDPLFNGAWELDDSLLTALKKMSRPAHRWIVIHLLSLAYLALVYPGCYLIARRYKGDYRVVFGALLGIVAVFSLALLVVGRRGYDERTALYSVAIARLTPKGDFDVAQWSNAFAVDGGDYTFSHPGRGRIYSTCQDEEPVRGELVAGASAHFTADMPPFSSRAFGHRSVLDRATLDATNSLASPRAHDDLTVADGAAAPVVVTDWETRLAPRQQSAATAAANLEARPERILQKLTLARRPGFPPEFHFVQALYGRHVYALMEKGDQFELKLATGTLATVLQLNQATLFGGDSDPRSEASQNSADPFDALFLPLVGRACNITRQRDALQFALPEDRLRVLVYAPMPTEFFAQNEQFVTQKGAVLYCFDVFLPEQQ